jgi:hypothetical protein
VNSWQPNERRRRGDDAGGSLPDPDAPEVTLFEDEMEKIIRRLHAVMEAGRSDFHDGSPAYDQAYLIVVRLTAMLEQTSPFAARFSGLTAEERLGIVTTRNIVSHIGYAAMNDDALWATVTVDIPRTLLRLGLLH